MADVIVVVIVFLVIPGTFVYWVWMVHASRRREALSPAGHCQHCGYDLRASHSRCPECGRAVPGSAEEEADRIARRYILDPRRLRDEWPATSLEPRIPTEQEGVATAYSTRNWFEADLLTQQIEARGISCRMVDEQNLPVRRAYGEALTYLLVVPEGDKQLAAEIIDSFRIHPPIKIKPQMGTDSTDKCEPTGPPPISHP